MKSSNSRVEFKPPEHAVPEGTMPGEDFVETCTFRVKEGGTICLVEFGDIRMPGYDDKNGSEKRPTYDKYRKSMMSDEMGESAMQESGGY